MPVDLCGHCGKNFSDKGLNEAIQCDLCAEWVHASCEGVSSDDYKLSTNLTSSEKQGDLLLQSKPVFISSETNCFSTLQQN